MGRRPPFAVTIPSARPPSPARRQPARRAIARRRRDEASRTWPVLARGDHGLAFRIRGAEPEDDAPRFMAEARGTRMMWCRPKRWKAARRAAVGVRGRSRRSAECLTSAYVPPLESALTTFETLIEYIDVTESPTPPKVTAATSTSMLKMSAYSTRPWPRWSLRPHGKYALSHNIAFSVTVNPFARGGALVFLSET